MYMHVDFHVETQTEKENQALIPCQNSSKIERSQSHRAIRVNHSLPATGLCYGRQAVLWPYGHNN